MRRIAWPVWVIPTSLLITLSLVLRLGHALPEKDLAEVAALVILGFSTSCAALRWLWTRQVWWVWLACFTASLLFREIHLDNTSVGAVILIIALLLYAWQHYDRFARHFDDNMTFNLLAMALFSYGLAVACDKGLLNFLSGGFHPQNQVEEFIEVLGHSAMLLMTLQRRPSLPGKSV